MSPDGKSIVFDSNRQATYDIWIMDANGENARVLIATVLDDVMPDWLGNDHVMYSSEDGMGWAMRTVNVNDGAITTIKNTGNLNKWPVWCSAQ